MASGNIFLNTTVLGQTALRDVHVCHHFDPRDNRKGEMARRWRHFVKSTINAITDFELVFERLEMDVTRAILDRLKQNEINETNDRRRVRFGLDRCGAFIAADL